MTDLEQRVDRLSAWFKNECIHCCDSPNFARVSRLIARLAFECGDRRLGVAMLRFADMKSVRPWWYHNALWNREGFVWTKQSQGMPFTFSLVEGTVFRCLKNHLPASVDHAHYPTLFAAYKALSEAMYDAGVL